MFLKSNHLIKAFYISGFSNHQSAINSTGTKSAKNIMKDTESMTGFDQKPAISVLLDTQSMKGFNLYDPQNRIDKPYVDNGSEEQCKESLEDTASMSQFSFVSTRSRKKYDLSYKNLPDTESMTNFSALSHHCSISPTSIKNEDISLVNFTLSDKLSTGLRDQTLYNKPMAPVVAEDSFSIDGSHLQPTNSSNSSKLSNSCVPEESLTVSETSSDNDKNASSANPTPEKAANKPTTENDDSESNEEKISITAKFNIRIQLSSIIADSIKEVQGAYVSEEIVLDKERTDSEDATPSTRESLKEDKLQGSQKTPANDKILEKYPETPKIVVNNHDNKSDFDDLEFESNVKLLTKLYGNEWKTPGVKEILISQSTKKKKLKPKDQNTHSAPHHNHSVGDFSNCK